MEAYAVPFTFDRSRAPLYRLVNTGPERLRGVSVALIGSGLLSPVLPGALAPGGALELRVRGADLARDAVLVVRWLRPDGRDYLWRVSF